MINERHQELKEICRKNGLKCTPQRLAVYEFIHSNLSHPNVDTVWSAVRKNLPSVTRESIYRILNEFSNIGILNRLDQIERARYDSQTSLHGHFICEKCGNIFDFDLPEKKMLSHIPVPGKAHHWEYRVVGICEDCAKASAGKKNED